MLKALTMYLIPSCFFVSLLGCSENSTPPVTLTKNDIQHVIVLMLENRSYDELLAGYQVSAPQQFQTAKYAIHKNGDRFTADGIVLNNTYLKQPYYLESMNTNKNTPVPSYDPGEAFFHMSNQIYNPTPAWTKNTTPTTYFPIDQENMGGFVSDYMKKNEHMNPAATPQEVMRVFTQSQVGTTYSLAKKFAVSDDWFGAAPAETYPNRSFLNSATSYGYVDNASFLENIMGLVAPTVFTTMAGSFHIYYESISINVLLSQELWGQTEQSNISHASQFEKDVASGNLAQFVLYEPEYFTFSGDSGHPNQGIANSQNLIAQLYNTLIQYPDVWNHTLLIVTYDENGGIYDHVSPPEATPPGGQYGPDNSNYKFGFNRLGVRVPTLIVSPFVSAGSLIEAPIGKHFDHTSIIRTVFDLYGCVKKAKHSDGCYLTNRDRNAPSLLPSLQKPLNNMTFTPLPMETNNTLIPGVKEDGSGFKDYCESLAVLKLKSPNNFGKLPEALTSYYSHCDALLKEMDKKKSMH